MTQVKKPKFLFQENHVYTSRPNTKDRQQYLFKFDNGYGASVIRSPFSYGGSRGLYELAVLIWDKDSAEITYNTEITDNVLGNLTVEGVNEFLIDIKGLDK